MKFCFLEEPCFPVTTAGGTREWRAFADLAETSGDYPVDFDWPRPDFNIAAFEFAIGVTTLLFHPQDPEDWKDLWRAPPTPEAVGERIAPLAHAFELDGDGPRFMQDVEHLEGKPSPIEGLLIDTPGENGQKKNADLLTHRARYPALGLPTAAMALYALQQFAPSGGAGNRTSMRGGGPMTTLVLPGSDGEPVPLWRKILANVAARRENAFRPDRDLPRVLPWLSPTLVSDKAHGERVVHETDPDVHPLQAFFGMPRRIRLVFEEKGTCAMTGNVGPVVTAFVQKPWGVNYGLWVHPLTPYRRQKEADPPLSFKPKSGRFGYRDWVATTVGSSDTRLASPAFAVHAARHERAYAMRGRGATPPYLRAGGWAMNNMEAMSYLTAEQPLHVAPDDARASTLNDAARRFADAADIVASLLRHALRAAFFPEGMTVDTQASWFDQARTGFFEATETPFHAALDAVAAGEPGENEAGQWRLTLMRAALAAFDEAAPMPLDDPKTARRIAGAYGRLSWSLRGYGKSGHALFERLSLAPPPVRRASAKEETQT